MKGGNGHFMIQFAKHYNPTNNTFKGIQLGIRLGRITRQVHIDEVFQGDQEAAVLAKLTNSLMKITKIQFNVLEDEEDEFCESDSDDSAADSDAQSSSSSECKQILEVSDNDLLTDFSDSESDPEIPELVIELTEAEKNTQKTLFAFFDQLTKDAISFIKERFAMFDTEPLCFFEAAFDIDMMMACCGTDKEWKMFGKYKMFTSVTILYKCLIKWCPQIMPTKICFGFHLSSSLFSRSWSTAFSLLKSYI